MVSSFHIRNLNTHRGRLITMKDHQSFYPFHRSSISIPSKETKLLAALEPDTNIIGENFLDSDEFWRLIVLGIAFLWATNFPVIKMIYNASPELDPELYSFIRFAIAGILFLPTAISSIKMKDMILEASFIGFVLFIGYFGQAMGLQESTAGKGAFICTLQIVFVALVSGWQKQDFKPSVWVSVSLALAGTALLELQGSQAPVMGDLWLMLQPLSFGGGYILLERLIGKYPDEARAITSWKLLSIAVLR